MSERGGEVISLETRMAFVLAAYFGGLYLMARLLGGLIGVGNEYTYIGFVVGFIALQNLGGPALFERRLGVSWLAQDDTPVLQSTVADLALLAEIRPPRVGISDLPLANAFAFGRTRKDGRICLTRSLVDRMDDGEMRAVVAHELCHIKSFDVTVLSLLSVVPMLSGALLAIPGALSSAVGPLTARLLLRLLAIVFTPLVLVVWLAMLPISLLSTALMSYGSRVREFSADRQAVRLGALPHYLASVLYKIATDKDSEEAHRLTGARGLLLEPRSYDSEEWSFLRRLDADGSGDISLKELLRLRAEPVSISMRDRAKEVFMSHPLVQKRFQRLADMA